MMASSKDKAISLKNNYVAGLIEAGATAPAPTMPNKGDQASLHMNLNTGQVGGINDGDPGSYIYSQDGSVIKGPKDPKYANPIKGPAGAKEVKQMPQQLHQDMIREDDMRRGITTGSMASVDPGLAGKLGMKQGEVAGDVYHIGRGEYYGFNDGDPTRIITDGTTKFKLRAPRAAYPIPGGHGKFGAGKMDQETRAQMSELIYNPSLSMGSEPVNNWGGPFQSYRDEYNHLRR